VRENPRPYKSIHLNEDSQVHQERTKTHKKYHYDYKSLTKATTPSQDKTLKKINFFYKFCLRRLESTIIKEIY